MWAGLLLFLLSMACAGGALLLLNRINASHHQSDLNLRSRVLGAEGAGYIVRPPSTTWRAVAALQAVFQRSGLELTDSRAGYLLFGLLGLGPLLCLLLGWFGGLLVTTVGLMCLWGLLYRAAHKRRLQLLEQMPAYLEGVMRVLSAGNTLEEALAASARESPEPIRALFLSVSRQVRLGATVEGVLAHAAETHGLQEVKVVALAAAINRKYGGSLRNVLRSVVSAIRSRSSAAREVRALTAETRFSALVLAIIPMTLSIYILLRNKNYYLTMWADPVGRAFLVGSLLWQLLGVAILWRMINRVGGH